MDWEAFATTAPALAALGRERLDKTRLVLLGTLRMDGWPRISPVEFLVFEGRLCLGMEWRSLKALDLQRDPRCSILNTVHNRDGSDGEFKLYGRAIEVADPETRSRYAHAVLEQMGFDLEDEPYHLFAIDIESASFAIIQDGEWWRDIWRERDATTG